MSITQGYKQIPEFVLRHPPFCGQDCEQFMVEARGEKFILPPRSLVWQIFHPETRGRMRKELGKGDWGLTTARIPHTKRVEFLISKLQEGVCPTIWVRTTLPFATHTVVIAAYETNTRGQHSFFLMDDRKFNGNSSHKLGCPVGNACWSEQELRRVWHEFAGTCAIAWIPS